MRYDPAVDPSASQWLALDEGERMALVERAHDSDMENLHLHAAIHAAIETQLAMDMPSVVDALWRLREEGLDRHEALHAIGSVLAAHMWAMMRDATADNDPNADYYAALDKLTVESWHRDYGSAPNDLSGGM